MVCEREMTSRITLGFLARTTRRMKLPSTEVGKTAGETVLVLNVLSCLLESTWGFIYTSYIHKFGEGERCLGRDVNVVVLNGVCVCVCARAHDVPLSQFRFLATL